MSKKPGEGTQPADTSSEKTEFVPGEESNEDFDSVLALLVGWVKAGIVTVNVDPDGRVTFDLPGEMRDLFGGEIPKGLTKKQVLEIIDVEIPVLTTAGFVKSPSNFFKHRVPESLHDRIPDLTKRSEKAMAALITGELKERVLLRRTTLSYVMKDIRSLSGSYESRSSTGKQTKLPFTTLEFAFVRPRCGATMVLVDPAEGVVSFGSKDEIQVRVDFHTADIKALVKQLTAILETERP